MSEVPSGQPALSLDRIRQSARVLFVRDGYHNTRPQDIVRDAGVAIGTFYIHFKDKKACFLDFSEQARVQLLRVYQQRLAGVHGFSMRMQVMLQTVIDFAITNPGVLQAAFVDPVFIAPDDLHAWRLYDELGHTVEIMLGDSDEVERLSETHDLELLSHTICGMLRHAMIFAARKKFDRDKLVGQLTSYIEALVGPLRDQSMAHDITIGSNGGST
jgi:AcrR family transcriptional regulator